mmetsp:Transcript_70560/g.199189  ORF Transcript_70560/g.199189 Transcript_70560/m.199189 type:complete len:568 (-) Transcript_70560:240-1943(-)
MFSSMISAGQSLVVEGPDGAAPAETNWDFFLKKVRTWGGLPEPSESTGAAQRVEAKVGKIAVSVRYHKAPRSLYDDYLPTSTILGTGFNGAVRQAESKLDSRANKYAVKVLRLNKATAEQRQRLTREMEIFLTLDHPRIARLFDVYESDDRFDLVMECMEGGELFARIAECKTFPEEDAACTIWQILLAVNYIHKNGFVHRDLKMENFLYAKKGGNLLKLIDFGFSKGFEESDSKKTRMGLTCGTLSYMAPEVLKKCYTSQCDLWSVGVIAFALVLGHMPFTGDERSQARCIERGQYTLKPKRWERISDAAKNFIESLLQVDPEKRLTAGTAIHHDWVRMRKRVGHVIDISMVQALRQFARSTRFRRCCMEMMAWSLSYDERLTVSRDFTHLDADKDGSIQLEEMQAVLHDKFNVPLWETRQIFDIMTTGSYSWDNDEDKIISYSKFLAAMVSTRIELHEDLVKATFKKFDTENLGYITVSSLRGVLGDHFDGVKVSTLVAEMGLPRNIKISYPEFESYLRRNPARNLEQESEVVKMPAKSRVSSCFPCLALWPATKSGGIATPLVP